LHAFGYVSDRLTARERKHFLGLLEDYRAEHATLAALIALLQSWVVALKNPTLPDKCSLNAQGMGCDPQAVPAPRS